MTSLPDVRYALRSWRQTPFTACAVVISLAVGLSANLAIFSWLDALVSRPLAGVPQQDDLVVVDGRTSSGRDQRLSYPDVRDLAAQLRQAEGVVAYTYQPFGLSDGEHAERVWGQLVTANFFDVLRVRPAIGRAFMAQEEAEGAGDVAVISESLWRRRFGSAPDIAGQAIQVNGHRLRIVGVAPRGFHGVAVGLLLDIWIPIGMQPRLGGGQPNRLHARDTRWLGAYARLGDGATLAGLNAELASFSLRSRAAHRENETTSFAATTLADAPWGGTNVVRPVLRILSVLAWLLLLAACANVTGLLVVRAISRRREMASRLALGASRARLVRQLCLENGIVGAAAAVAAGAASLWSTRLFAALLPPTGFPVGFTLAMDAWWLATLMLLTLGTITLIGVAPVLHAVSTPLVTVLREEATAVLGGARRGWLRTCLIGVQVALATALLIVSGMLVKALAYSRAIDTGFDRERVLLASIDLSQAGYSPDRGKSLLRRLHGDIAALNGVDSMSFAQRVPLDFGGRGIVSAAIDGYTPAPGEEVALALNHVGPGYLKTLKVPLVAGREFAVADDESAERVALVNERAARMYFGARGALNGRLTVNGASMRVVGVFADIRQDSLTQPAPPAALVPMLQAYRPGLVLHVSSAGDPARLATAIRAAIARTDPALAVYDVRTMAAHLEVPTFSYRLGSSVALALGATALLLGILGLYASVSRDIVQRGTEIGIRMALGATRAQVMRSTAARAVGAVVAGASVGVAGAVVVVRTVGAAIGIATTDASAFAIALAVVLLACYAAILVPMRAAVLATPLTALRGR